MSRSVAKLCMNIVEFYLVDNDQRLIMRSFKMFSIKNYFFKKTAIVIESSISLHEKFRTKIPVRDRIFKNSLIHT